MVLTLALVTSVLAATDGGLSSIDAGTSANVPGSPERIYIAQRLGSRVIANLYADRFSQLTPDEKKVAYYLTLAAHAGEDIQYDQLGWNNLAVKRLMEGVYLAGVDPAGGPMREAVTEYLTLFYANIGNHDSDTAQKFLPRFTYEQLEEAALTAFTNGNPFGLKDEAAVRALLAQTRQTLFDPSFEPRLTSKVAAPGKDILTSSSNTNYGKDVTLQDLEGFKEQNALNSRVVKVNGKLQEQVFRAGTPDGKVPKGLYAEQLARVNAYLKLAAKHAQADQKDALNKLVTYFQTGSLADWDRYNIAWLKANPRVDANIGFIETYVDARGQKGQWEALINYADPKDNRIMEELARRAQHFEDRMPWPQQYKRQQITLPVAKAIVFVTAYPTPPAGINLPNEQHIREKYGSKSVLVANTMETAHVIARLPLSQEFSPTEELKDSARVYGADARKLLVAFHEVTGHASGKVSPANKDPSGALKEYDNTLEEARADLVALWHAFDPAVAQMGFSNAEAVAKEMYSNFVVEGLTNLRKVEKGDRFEEDHQRGHHMTLGYLMEKGVVKQQPVAGKTYWTVTDHAKMRAAVGELLSRLMVIKATGDYDGIKALVEKYGVRFDPKLRDEVVSRVKASNIPTQSFLVSPRLVPVLDKKGALVDVKVEHGQSFLAQHLERSVLGRLDPKAALKRAAAAE